MDPFLGQIALLACDFAPVNWAMCQGQLLPIRQYTALFSLLGTTFGGDGKVTFSLPDLRGRVPLGQGQGPGLSPYDMGEQGGSEQVALASANIPSHSHGFLVYSGPATGKSPANALLAQGLHTGGHGAGVTTDLYNTANPTIALAQGQVAPAGTGNSAPHDNLQPFLALTWCIALVGVFPARP